MNSHLTAINRKNKLPVPTRWLLKNGLLKGKVLDYGCGKCKPINDAILTKVPGIDSVISFDPYWETNVHLLLGHYDVITCTYVICTLDEDAASTLLWWIQFLLKPTGKAYIAVRADKPKNGWGYSSRKTFQREVIMDFLPEIRKTSQYRIYLLTKDSKLS